MLSRRSFLRRTLSTGSGVIIGSGMARAAPPLLGAVSAVLASCSDPTVAPTVVPLFSPDRVLAAGRPQRIPFAIVSPGQDGGERVALPPDDGEVAVTVRLDGTVVAEAAVAGRVVNHDHVGQPDPDHQHADLFRYYPLRATLPRPGIYDLTIAVAGTEATMAIQMFDAAEISVPLVGDRFPSVITPTFADPHGVDRICTRVEPCPFHTISAGEALQSGRALAVLVATPAFCSTAYCGPVLDTLIDESSSHPDIEFIHVEVYANTDEVRGNILDPRIRVAPAVEALGLEFEPSLFLVSAAGIVVDRIDNVFDRTELASGLGALAA